jgi:hypothetical protein
VVLTPGRVQQRLLRALAAGPHDGRRAGRGPRPVLPGGRVWMRTTAGPAPRRRASTGASTTTSSIRCVFRDDSYLGSPGLMTSRAQRHGDHRERGGQRGGRRQARLHLRARPRSGTTSASSRSCATSTRGGWRSRTRSRRCWTGSTSSSSSPSTARAARARGRPKASAAELATLKVRLRTTREAGSRSRSCSSRPCPTLVEDGLRPRHTDLRPFAVNDGESVFVLPAGSPAWRCPRASSSSTRRRAAGRRTPGCSAARSRAVRSVTSRSCRSAVPQDAAVPIDSNPNDVRAQVMQQQQGRTTTAGGSSC